METSQQQQASSHHLMKRVIDSKTPQECLTSVSSSPKPNQVSTVLLYGIPIVSLFIEGQERLCLAQISNTLLKQYSYNEIHNRRVALGITCVQCTPVQLEILRRAGAMPVSSRRCGMITRREAERLCKSFLGDNSPPRLPEDFAFSVHHECAWGCRGSFLPARYNSSRAKCIKCAYCGLFFSPNKFIFHSHRIGPADKYVQPDAANFNSWRRHMKLSGNPPEEIIHAWEDVKAMFNGGTRKRLIISATSANGNGHGGHGGRNSSRNDMSSPKRLKEIAPLNSSHELNPPVIHAAAAVTVVSAGTATSRTAADSQHPIRPIQLLPNGQITSTANNNVNSLTTPIVAVASPSSAPIAPSRIPSALCSDLPLHFTRGFMMDYMWHAQTKASAFQFSNYALPWIKRPGTLFLNQQPHPQQQQQSAPAQQQAQPTQSMVNGSPIESHPLSSTISNMDDTYLSGDSPAPSISTTSPPPPSKPSSLPFYNNSAFRPVVNHHHNHHHQIHMPTRSNTSIMPAGSSKHLDDDQRTLSSRNSRDGSGSGSATIKDSLSSDDDDEMVDIETTEEDENHHHHHQASHQRYYDPYQSRVMSTHPYRHIDDLIAVKVPKSPPAATAETEPIADNISCWNDPTTADYLKKRLSCRNLTTIQTTTIVPTPSPPPIIVSHSSPASSSSCGAAEGASDSSATASDLLTSREHQHHHNMLRLTSGVATTTPPTIMLDPMNAIPRAAAAAAAAVAIAAFSHSTAQSSPSPTATTTTTPPTPSGMTIQKSIYDSGGGAISPSTFTQNIYSSSCDKGLMTNSIYSNLILNNNNNNNNNINSNSRSNISNSSINNASSSSHNNNNNSNNNSTTSGHLGAGNAVKIKNNLNGRLTTSSSSPINCSAGGGGVASNERLCSVARLSFDRMDYASVSSSPFYRHHESSKHFQPFRHQSEQITTPTNGGIG